MADDAVKKEWPCRYRMNMKGSVDAFTNFSNKIAEMKGHFIGDVQPYEDEWLVTVGFETQVAPADLDRTATDAGLAMIGRTTQLGVFGDHILLGTKKPR
jgi:hypothetical protein